jgi:hypothetical protein
MYEFIFASLADSLVVLNPMTRGDNLKRIIVYYM